MASKYMPALDATRLLPGGLRDHASQVRRVLAEVVRMNPSRRGITAAIAEEEEVAVGWLIEGLTQATAHVPPVPLALPKS